MSNAENVVSLGKKRVEKENYSRNWTPKEAIKRALEVAESWQEGEVEMVYIAMRTKKGDEYTFPMFISGNDRTTMMGLLQTHMLLLHGAK
jgi:hypothetical protein